MKKIVFMLAAVAMAASLQAASVVNWTTGTLYAPGADGTGFGDPVADGTTGYLATLLVGTGYSGDSLTGLVDFSEGASSSEVANGGTLSGTTNAALTDDTTYYAQLIVTYGDSTLTSQIVAIETSSMSGSADPYFGDGGMMIEALPGQSLDGTYGAFSSAGWTKAGGSDPAIPEPTSGLLMLVGLGALALRRRR